MEASVIYEIIGYVASILIAVSLMMKAIVKLRVINLIGAAFFALYGVLIGSIPVTAMNGFIVVINIYYLIQIYGAKEFFTLLEVKGSDSYLNCFLSFYREDIAKFLPFNNYEYKENDICVFILRDMVPAGVFIGRKEGESELFTEVDYVISQYRDFKTGGYLFSDKKEFFTNKGISTISAKAENKDHSDYLQKMGFKPHLNKANTYQLDL